MRLFILLLSAFFTALAGVGSVAHASQGSSVVAATAEAEPLSDERALILPGDRPQNAPRALRVVAAQFPVAVQRHAPLFVDRLRL